MRHANKRNNYSALILSLHLNVNTFIMENQSYPVAKHSLMYGVYTSVLLIILSLVFYVLDLQAASWPVYISYAGLLGGIVITSLHYRDNRMNGFATYGQSFSSGFLAGLFASIILGVFTFIFATVMGDEYREMMLKTAEDKILESNPDISDEQFDMAMKFTEGLTKPWWMAFITILNFTFVSLILSLIAAIFIKKPKPENTGA